MKHAAKRRTGEFEREVLQRDGELLIEAFKRQADRDEQEGIGVGDRGQARRRGVDSTAEALPGGVMLPIESLGLSANQWQFLSAPDRYVKASKRSDRTLVLESTRRQFLTARDILARLNGSYGEEARRGVLLADDVGLGKTTVAALVAWVVASAGEKRRVRILAPNDVMMRRWEEELDIAREASSGMCARLSASRRTE